MFSLSECLITVTEVYAVHQDKPANRDLTDSLVYGCEAGSEVDSANSRQLDCYRLKRKQPGSPLPGCDVLDPFMDLEYRVCVDRHFVKVGDPLR
jgi:hypothetical protein